MTTPWADLELVNAQKMYDRIEARLAVLESRVLSRPIFLARQTVATTLTTGTNTSITFTTHDTDTAGGHSTVTNTSRYTCQVTGQFIAVGLISYVTNVTGSRGAQFYVNGSPLSATRTLLNTSTGTGSLPAGITTGRLVSLTAGDYIELLGLQNSGGNLATSVSGQDASMFALYGL